MNTLLYNNVIYEDATKVVILVIGCFSLYLGWYALERLVRLRPRRKPGKELPRMRLDWAQHVRQTKDTPPTAAATSTLLDRATFIPRKTKRALSGIYSVVAPNRWKLIALFALVLVGWISYMSHYYFTRPYITYTSFTAATQWYDLTQPLTVVFDKPVKINKVSFNISPSVPLRYEWVPAFESLPLIKLYREVRLYPQQTISPDEQLFVYAVGIESISGNDGVHEHNIELQNAFTPQIKSASVAEGTKDVGTNPEIDFELDNPSSLAVEWQVVTEPESQAKVMTVSPTKLRVNFAQPLAQSTQYKLVLQRAIVEKALPSQTLLAQESYKPAFTLQFSTVKTPLLGSFEPTGSGVTPRTHIVVNFDLDMDRASVEAAMRIEPHVEGTFIWSSDRKVTFKPNAQLAFDTKYTVTLAASMRSQKGGVLGQKFTKEFQTLGTVYVLGFSPGDKTRNVELNSTVTISFDQPVNKSSAQNAVRFSPSLSGSFSWSGNKLFFRPTNMQFSRTYTITVSAGVKSIYGRDSDKSYSSSFTVAPQVFELNVPRYYQGSGTYHCNVVALRMALAYRGIYRSTDQVIAGLGVGPALSGSYGGNPNQDWVDNYGVHWGPVAAYTQGFRGAAVRQNWNLTDMLQEVKKGNPSVIWTQNGVSSWYWKTWNTPGGGTVTGLNGMHSLVVIGYEGPVSNPTYVIVNNPWGGRQRHTRSGFDTLWRNSFNRTAVVIY